MKVLGNAIDHQCIGIFVQRSGLHVFVLFDRVDSERFVNLSTSYYCRLGSDIGTGLLSARFKRT